MTSAAVAIDRSNDLATLPRVSDEELPFIVSPKIVEVAQIYTISSSNELRGLLKSGQCTSEELLQAAYLVMRRADPQTGAISHLWSYQECLEELRNSTEGGGLGPIPILSKFSREKIEGRPFTLGFEVLERLESTGNPNLSSETSPIVHQIRKSGLYIVGDTRISQACLTPTCGEETDLPPHNPWGAGYSPGGSSGGAAIAVATGMGPLATATDSAGSIRIPASYNGLFGLKPTGVAGASETLAHLSVSHALSRSVEDSRLYFEHVTGEAIAERRTPEKLKVAVLLDAPGVSVHSECIRAVIKVARHLEDRGHDISEITSLPVLSDVGFQDSMERLSMYYALGVVKQLGDWIGRAPKREDMSPVTWTMACGGIVNFKHKDRDFDYIQEIPGRFQEATKQWDLILSPTVYAPPPKIGAVLPPPERLTGDFNHDRPLLQETINRVLFTAPFNVTGNPACSVPVHFATLEDGIELPIGVQMVARHREEHVLFDVAAGLQEEFRWHEKIPPLHAANFINQ